MFALFSTAFLAWMGLFLAPCSRSEHQVLSHLIYIAIWSTPFRRRYRDRLMGRMILIDKLQLHKYIRLKYVGAPSDWLTSCIELRVLDVHICPQHPSQRRWPTHLQFITISWRSIDIDTSAKSPADHASPVDNLQSEHALIRQWIVVDTRPWNRHPPVGVKRWLTM